MIATTVGSELFSLQGKTFLIAGGTRGIGREISLRFARAGAKVLASYLRDEKCAQEVKVIAEEEKLSISLCRADLASDNGLQILSNFLAGEGADLSGLVFSAATGIHRPLDELTERHFDWTFDLNVRAFFRLMKLLRPRLSRGASVVVISSLGASRVLPNYSLVGSSKAALESLSRHLAVEFAASGVRVNILTAGAIRTDAWKAIPNSDERIAEAVRRTPLGRLLTAEEIAYGAQFLCSDASSGAVGQTLILDGGFGIMA